jgi:SAM-dependent methyltransferase
VLDRCPICGEVVAREVFRTFRPRSAASTGRHTEDLFGRAGRIVRCVSCGLARQVDPPTAPYEETEDPEYLSEEDGIRRTFAKLIERVEVYRPPPGRLLDAGCGPGLLLDEARRRGWTTAGVEPSAWGVERAKRAGLDVTQGTLETVDTKTPPFDVIVAADVIEHVDDPRAFMDRINRLLVVGGILLVATPNVDSIVARVLRRWWWSVIPNHLWFFSPRTLRMLMEDTSFEVVECTTHPKTFSVEYYAGRFGGYNTPVGALFRQASQLLGGADRLVTPDFRDRTAMIARKTSRE